MPQVNPKWFQCEAGLIDWGAIWEQQIRQFYMIHFADQPDVLGTVLEQLPNARGGFVESIETLGFVSRGAHLRWSTHPELGIPSRAFRVWRRLAAPFQEQLLAPDELTTWNDNGLTVISWGRPLALVRFHCTVPASGGLAFGFSGSPTLERTLTIRALSPNRSFYALAAPALTGMILPSNVALTGIQGVDAQTVADDPNWEEVERVGLPVDPAEWAGIGDHTDPQGLLADGLVSPFDAAIQRYTRGRAAVGWPSFLEPGVSAPPFSLPDGLQLIEEMREQILGLIRDRMSLPPMQMHDALEQFTMPPPENATGEVAPTEPSEATYSPLGLMLAGVTSDPNLSLILGYGTTIAQEDFSLDTSEVASFPGPDDYHYMITAEWDQGVTGNGPPLELAALALQPHFAFAGAAPANMEAQQSNPMMPVEPDGPWRRSVRFSWDRVPRTGLYRVASFAAMRRAMQPAGQSELMNEPRESGGFRPIAANAVAGDPDTGRVSSADRVVEIPPAVSPANNGFIQMRYAAVTQTIFGLWGDWSFVEEIVREPFPARVPILAALLEPEPPAVPDGLCPATLTVEFTWDWSVRTPETILISGRLWSAAKRSDPPPSEVPVMILPRTLGGADQGLQVTFTGDVPSVTGATIVGLTGDGESFADFGPAQGEDIRRYRVTVPDFALDFDAAPHIGVHLFARVFERRAPGRIGPFPEHPFAFAVSDPRPPEVVLTPVDVASLPDARGESHARLDWPPQPSVRGYFIYEATESDLRAELGLPPSQPDQTLTERRAEVVDAYNLNPVRRPFTRRYSKLEHGTSRDVTLPKGSRDIHFFAILAQSQSGLDSPWPTDGTPGDQLFAIAAPLIAKPQPPLLELRRVPAPGGGFQAQIAVTPRIGHRARRVRIFRTRLAEAARRIDTMGPPIAALDMSSGGWTVETADDDVATGFIAGVTGTDSPEGAWQRVWYRAEVWSGEDADRALLPGRSDPSPPQFVVIPPDGDPDLSPLDLDWPGGAPGDVLVRWSSAAPIAETPLGAHHMSIDIRAAAGAAEAVLSEDRALAHISSGQTGTDMAIWWREGAPDAAGIQQYRALIRRGPSRPRMSVSVRLRDPLGRLGEQLVEIPGGPVLPPPVITNLTAQAPARGMSGARWTMNAPLTAGPAGPWRVEITAEVARERPGGFDPGFRLRARAIARPRNRLLAPGGVAGPGRIVNPGRGLRLRIDVPEIALRRTGPREVTEGTLVVWRQALGRTTLGFGVASGSRLSSITIRLLAPDGQTTTETVEIS